MPSKTATSRKRKMNDEKAEDDVLLSDDAFSQSSLSELDNFSIETDFPLGQKNPIIDLEIALEIHYEYTHLNRDIHQKFMELTVTVDWKVPIAHNSLTYRDGNKVRKMMLLDGQTIKSGRFTIEEDELIITNWCAFKKEYGFDDPKYFLPGFLPKGVFSDGQKRAFVQHLARGLPHRTLRIVYDRFYEIFSGGNTGRFEYVEDQMLLNVISSSCKYFKIHSKLKVLEAILGRKKIPIIRRSKSLRSHSQPCGLAAPVDWNMELCQKLITALLERKGFNDVSLLENIVLDQHDWLEISEKLGVNDLYLDFFWNTQLSCLLFAKESISRNKLRFFLITWFLAHKEIQNWPSISWEDVSDSLNAPKFLCYRVFRNMIFTYVPEEMWSDFRGCIDHLYNNYFELFSSKKLKDRYFKRLLFE